MFIGEESILIALSYPNFCHRDQYSSWTLPPHLRPNGSSWAWCADSVALDQHRVLLGLKMTLPYPMGTHPKRHGVHRLALLI